MTECAAPLPADGGLQPSAGRHSSLRGGLSAVVRRRCRLHHLRGHDIESTCFGYVLVCWSRRWRTWRGGVQNHDVDDADTADVGDEDVTELKGLALALARSSADVAALESDDVECLIPVLVCFLKHAADAGGAQDLSAGDFADDGDGIVLYRKLAAALESIFCLFQVHDDGWWRGERRCRGRGQTLPRTCRRQCAPCAGVLTGRKRRETAACAVPAAQVFLGRDTVVDEHLSETVAVLHHVVTGVVVPSYDDAKPATGALGRRAVTSFPLALQVRLSCPGGPPLVSQTRVPAAYITVDVCMVWGPGARSPRAPACRGLCPI